MASQTKKKGKASSLQMLLNSLLSEQQHADCIDSSRSTRSQSSMMGDSETYNEWGEPSLKEMKNELERLRKEKAVATARQRETETRLSFLEQHLNHCEISKVPHYLQSTISTRRRITKRKPQTDRQQDNKAPFVVGSTSPSHCLPIKLSSAGVEPCMISHASNRVSKRKSLQCPNGSYTRDLSEQSLWHLSSLQQVEHRGQTSGTKGSKRKKKKKKKEEEEKGKSKKKTKDSYLNHVSILQLHPARIEREDSNEKDGQSKQKLNQSFYQRLYGLQISQMLEEHQSSKTTSATRRPVPRRKLKSTDLHWDPP